MSLVPATVGDLAEVMAELSSVLWKQRNQIEMLQYRLEVQQLICATATERRLQIAVDEVEVALEEIRRSERARDAVVRQCAQLLALASDASLADIRSRVPEPWHSMLADHQEALLAMVADAENLAARNRELALRGAHDARALLDAVTGGANPSSYGPSSGVTSARGTLLDHRV